MKSKIIKRVYKEYFLNTGLGKNDFVDFLRDVYDSSVEGSVSFAISNFPNQYRWESLIRYGEIKWFIIEALKYNTWESFKSSIFKKGLI